MEIEGYNALKWYYLAKLTTLLKADPDYQRLRRERLITPLMVGGGAAKLVFGARSDMRKSLDMDSGFDALQNYTSDLDLRLFIRPQSDTYLEGSKISGDILVSRTIRTACHRCFSTLHEQAEDNPVLAVSVSYNGYGRAPEGEGGRWDRPYYGFHLASEEGGTQLFVDIGLHTYMAGGLGLKGRGTIVSQAVPGLGTGVGRGEREDLMEQRLQRLGDVTQLQIDYNAPEDEGQENCPLMPLGLIAVFNAIGVVRSSQREGAENLIKVAKYLNDIAGLIATAESETSTLGGTLESRMRLWAIYVMSEFYNKDQAQVEQLTENLRNSAYRSTLKEAFVRGLVNPRFAISASPSDVTWALDQWHTRVIAALRTLYGLT